MYHPIRGDSLQSIPKQPSKPGDVSLLDCYTVSMLHVRPYHEDDAFACLTIDPGYVTRQSFRLSATRHTVSPSFTLQPVELPRPRAIEGWPLDPPFEVRRTYADFSLVIEQDGIQGYLLGSKRATSLSVDLLVIAPEWRRQGLGSVLLEKARAWAIENRLRWIDVEIEARNEAALSFLRHQSFDIIGIRDDTGRGGQVVLTLTAAVQPLGK